MSDFSELGIWLQRINEQLDDNGKRRLTQRISQKLKRSLATRIRSQVSPDGGSFPPRKRDHARSIRRGAMFQRLPRMIKTAYTSSHAEVGYVGNTARVMKVHQYGLTARPSPITRAVRYPVRETVGFSNEDEQMIIEEIKGFLMEN